MLKRLTYLSTLYLHSRAVCQINIKASDVGVLKVHRAFVFGSEVCYYDNQIDPTLDLGSPMFTIAIELSFCCLSTSYRRISKVHSIAD